SARAPEERASTPAPSGRACAGCAQILPPAQLGTGPGKSKRQRKARDGIDKLQTSRPGHPHAWQAHPSRAQPWHHWRDLPRRPSAPCLHPASGRERRSTRRCGPRRRLRQRALHPRDGGSRGARWQRSRRGSLRGGDLVRPASHSPRQLHLLRRDRRSPRRTGRLVRRGREQPHDPSPARRAAPPGEESGMSSHAYGNNGPSSRGVVTAEPVVAVTSLTKRFGAFVAVDDLTFALEAGTVTGFLGPNGAGKTTTLRVLLGLAEPTNGRAPVFGRPYQALVQPAPLAGATLESADFPPARAGLYLLRV